MKKRILSLVLVLCMVLSLMPGMTIGASAADAAADWTYPTSSPSTPFAGGTGTVDDPYKIATAQQLANLAWLVNEKDPSYPTKCYAITGNINLNYQEWTPIGKTGAPFAGTFNGGGYTISGLKITTTTTNAGLFGRVTSGKITNLNIQTPQISPPANYAGAVAGVISDTTVEDCAVFGGTVTNSGYAGGIVGAAVTEIDNDCTLTNCFNSNTTITGSRVGGICGYGENGEVILTITNCGNSGQVNGKYLAGGIIGGYCANITQCYNSGDVTTTSLTDYAGGIIGSLNAITDGSKTFSVTQCGNVGNVRSVVNAGGIAGNAGGTAATTTAHTIAGCYSTGSVTANQYAGGVAGYIAQTSITDCYTTGDVTVTGTNDSLSAGGIAGYADLHYNTPATLSGCYSTGNVSGNNSVGGCFGRIYPGRNKPTNCVALGLSVTSAASTSYVGRVAGNGNTGDYAKLYANGYMTVTSKSGTVTAQSNDTGKNGATLTGDWNNSAWWTGNGFTSTNSWNTAGETPTLNFTLNGIPTAPGAAAGTITQTTPSVPAPHIHNDITFNEWTESTTLPTSGNYYLTGNVILSSAAASAASQTLNLCLNGYQITVTGTDQRILDVYGTLNLYDGSTGTGKLVGHTITPAGAGVYVYSGGTFNMYGGTITGCHSTATTAAGGGGGVYVASGATFNMQGGTITGNSSKYRGGGVDSNGTVNLGGSAVITGNTNGSTAASNLYGKATITSALTCADGSIGLSGETGTDLITAGSGVTLDDQRAKFSSDNASYDVVTVGSALQLVACTCAVSAPTIKTEYASGASIEIPYNKTNATFALSSLIGTAGSLSGNCLISGHSATTVTYTYSVTPTTGASISSGVLTVSKTGTYTVTVKSTANGKTSAGVTVTFAVTKGEAPPPHIHAMTADCSTNSANGSQITFDTRWSSAITGAQTISANQQIVLMEDVTLTSLTISGLSSTPTNVYLCLNGHKLTVTNGIAVGNYGQLSVCDCSADHLTGSIVGTVSITDTGNKSESGVNIHGGTIDKIVNTTVLGSNSTCNVNIFGGSIGSVTIKSDKYFYMTGGKITGGITTEYANGVTPKKIKILDSAVVDGKITIKGGNEVTVSGNAKVGDIETSIATGATHYSIINVYDTPKVGKITLDDVGTASSRKEYINTHYPTMDPYTGDPITINCKNGWGDSYVVIGANNDNYMKFVPDSASGKVFRKENATVSLTKVYALFADTGCAVSYDKNGGASGTAPTGGTYVQGQKITLPGQGGMTYADHVFKGWSTGEFGAIIPDDDANTAGVQWTVPTTETSVTLYAIWASTVVPGGNLTTLDKSTLDGVLGEYNYSYDEATKTIKLLSDIQLSTTLTFAGVESVFDLNGHAITNKAGVTYAGICLGGGSTDAATKVTIKDSVGTGSVTGKGGSGYGALEIYAKNSGDVLKIEGGTFTGVGCAGIAAGSPDATVSLTISGGKFVGADGKYGANFGYGGVNLVVTGGTFTGGGTSKAAYLGDSNADTATYALSGGSFTNGIKSDKALSTLLTPGYTFYKDGSAVTDLTGKELSGSITVAKSPEAKYTTDGTNTVMGSFTDAVANAQENSTITLIGDVELAAKVEIGKNLTIVAEGNRTIKQMAAGSNSYGLLYVGSNTLTLGKETGMGSSNTLTIDGQGYSGYALIEGKTTLYDGVTLQNSGGYGIFVNSGTANIYGGEIKNCKGNSINLNGSGAYADMSGGKISGGKSSAVYLNGSNAKFTMTGGKICGNSGNYAIDFNSTGTAVLSGGKIYGNSTSYGAVEADGSGIVQLSGNIQIYDNYRGGTLNDKTGLYEGTAQANIYFDRGNGVNTQPHVTLRSPPGAPP